MNTLPLGLKETPPLYPWGINFGGGLNSTAMIIECRNRGLTPNWILFADTGSEKPGTLDHVHKMREWCSGWVDLTIVRWERTHGDVIGFEPLHDACLRTGYLPSKAYGFAGCTSKWKIYPMEKWRKQHGFDKGCFAVGYDYGETNRIKTACARGDMPDFTAWYPLIAWKIDRTGCEKICEHSGIKVGKSSCFICPNMKRGEWLELRKNHKEQFDLAMKIEDQAIANGNPGRGGVGLYKNTLRNLDIEEDIQLSIFDVLEDRCHHGGCFT